MSDVELAAVIKIYGTAPGDNTSVPSIEYLPFLKDCDVLRYVINDPYSGAKATYIKRYIDFSGSPEVEALMKKVKDGVMRNRIRLGEFLQDHDPLRKGTIEATKFRTTLYAQKLQLTVEEYQLLEDHYRDPNDPIKIRYFDFNEDIERIFTLKDLEKNPGTTLDKFKAPSILDPKNVLTNDEEDELEGFMRRIGTYVRHRRLLIKPFFQDKDRSNSGFVTNTRFRSIFDNQKLWINDREYFLINKRF